MSKLHHYISMMVFAAALMLGVQVPNFVDQYVKRVDAHLKEARTGFEEFLKIARHSHKGSVEDLIKKHENSTDPTFKAEAAPLKKNYLRLKLLESEMLSLQGSFWSQSLHIILHANREILSDTYNHFSANLPLNSYAAICGLLFGLLASLLLEMFWSLFWKIFSFRRKPKKQKPSKEKELPERRAEPYIKN